MKSYVLDPEVVLEAMRNPMGPAGEYLRKARRLEIGLVANIGLALEYETLCADPDQRHAAGLSKAEAETFAAAIVALATPVETRRLWSPRLRDPTDEMMLEAAVNGQADAIVTHKTKDFAASAARFGIEVMTPDD